MGASRPRVGVTVLRSSSVPGAHVVGNRACGSDLSQRGGVETASPPRCDDRQRHSLGRPGRRSSRSSDSGAMKSYSALNATTGSMRAMHRAGT